MSDAVFIYLFVADNSDHLEICEKKMSHQLLPNIVNLKWKYYCFFNSTANNKKLKLAGSSESERQTEKSCE